jgi:hypothetical protein
VPSGAASSVSAANSILYQISGSTEVSVDGGAKTLSAGEGLFIAGGKTASLKAGSAQPSTFLHFLLAPAARLDQPAETAPATMKELYRTTAPIPDLKPGGYDLNPDHVPAADALQSASPSVRSSALLHHLRNGR